jgi:trans-2,3-dihydro-3-hydroxyanthranilate isomerase
MSLAYVIVDVFADTPLQGNQPAVFEDGSALSDDQMQRLAREMNLSETVFLLPAEARSPQGTGHRSRCFTIFSHLVVRRIAPNWIICARKAAAVHEPG